MALILCRSLFSQISRIWRRLQNETLPRGGPTASHDSHEIAFAFHVCVQKSIEQRCAGVSKPLEVQTWDLYCTSAVRCGDN